MTCVRRRSRCAFACGYGVCDSYFLSLSIQVTASRNRRSPVGQLPAEPLRRCLDEPFLRAALSAGAYRSSSCQAISAAASCALRLLVPVLADDVVFRADGGLGGEFLRVFGAGHAHAVPRLIQAELVRLHGQRGLPVQAGPSVATSANVSSMSRCTTLRAPSMPCSRNVRRSAIRRCRTEWSFSRHRRTPPRRARAG